MALPPVWQRRLKREHCHAGSLLILKPAKRSDRVLSAERPHLTWESTMATPSPGYSITVRVEAPTDPAATARLSSVVAEAGGAITALDVAESHPNMLVVDVSCNASDVAHSESITKAIAALDGFSVRKVSDRTFLLHLGGKIEVTPKVPLKHRDDLSRAYTPGVARVCLAIAENPADARRLTIKRNTIAVVTDGSAVLGLGNIGPEAALPVMEGKAALFKRFAGVDAWPVCLDTQDSDKIVEIVKAIAPVYGGVNLEDISAPRCFEIEERLRAELDIPVFHDDQHGTAIVVLAALINALRVVRKDIAEVRFVISGVGAAGSAIIRLLKRQGATMIIGCDSKGAVYDAPDGSSDMRRWLVENTNPEKRTGSLKEVLVGADVFIGVSGSQPARCAGRREHGQGCDRLRAGQPRPGGRPDGGATACGRCGHRPQRLPQSDQQRAGFPWVLPWTARRRPARHQRRDAVCGGKCHRQPGRAGPAEPELHHSQRV